MTENENGRGLEERLARDEARLARDEARLAFDEARIAEEGEEIHENAIVANTSVALAVVLAIAVAALVIAVIGLRRDVGTLAAAAPADSVATRSIQDSAVDAHKLSDSAVVRSVIADGAVGTQQIAAGAITGAHVATDSLTGAAIRERTLGTVPTALRARDAAHLAGRPASAYLSRITNVTATTVADARRTKGPLSARCPAGTRVVSGGAAVRGTATGVALVASAPDGDGAWAATAHRRSESRAWRLVVTAICATGGR